MDINVKERIQELMEQKGWSRYTLAQKSGLSASTISNIFCRGSEPSIATLVPICKAFEIPLYEFFIPCETPDGDRVYPGVYLVKRRMVIRYALGI